MIDNEHSRLTDSSPTRAEPGPPQHWLSAATLFAVAGALFAFGPAANASNGGGLSA